MDDQLTFYLATQEIERSLGISRGYAQAKLRELCASGVVRSWKEPYSMLGGEPQGEGPEERIEPYEWRQREIDLMTDSDGCKYFVNVSKTDLLAWLKTKKGKAAPSHKRDKRNLAAQAINDLWPNDIPGDLPNPQILKRVDVWIAAYCKRKNILSKLTISSDTILRAAGRKGN